MAAVRRIAGSGAALFVLTVLAAGCGESSGSEDRPERGGVFRSEPRGSGFDPAVPDAEDCYSDGETAGEEAGRTAGFDVGYSDAENGDSREASMDSSPDFDATEYDPGDCDESDYDDGYATAYSDSYEAAYDEGYDEALDYYGDPTVENPYDEDCEDVGGPVYVDEDDPDHLDTDGDGIGCE